MKKELTTEELIDLAIKWGEASDVYESARKNYNNLFKEIVNTLGNQHISPAHVNDFLKHKIGESYLRGIGAALIDVGIT